MSFNLSFVISDVKYLFCVLANALFEVSNIIILNPFKTQETLLVKLTVTQNNIAPGFS